MQPHSWQCDVNFRLGIAYDFRNPPDSGRTHKSLYAEVLSQVKWLDGLGADLAWFTEHHFVDDGYLPSWVPVAGAMAAVTENRNGVIPLLSVLFEDVSTRTISPK